MDRGSGMVPDILLEAVGGDREAAAELLDLFFEQGGEGVARMDGAADAGHGQAVRAEAHKLAGSALVCGLSRLADDLKDLELRCLDGLPPDVGARLASIRRQLGAARTYFEERWDAG